jgi:aryl-alcohol dehydrogenase-like predicted oxidoreductase
LSNVSVDQLETAARIVPIAAVQNSFSPYDLSSRSVVAWCHDREVPFVAWAPLGGADRAHGLGADATTALCAEIAATRSVSVAQVVLAWVLAYSPVVAAIPGARRPNSISDSAAAASLRLTDDEQARLDRQLLPGSSS